MRPPLLLTPQAILSRRPRRATGNTARNQRYTPAAAEKYKLLERSTELMTRCRATDHATRSNMRYFLYRYPYRVV
jgi:hypothetical protein